MSRHLVIALVFGFVGAPTAPAFAQPRTQVSVEISAADAVAAT